MSHKDCPFCALEKKTEWYYSDSPIHIVEDLHNRGYKLRLLAVPVGEDYHKPYDEFSEDMKAELTIIGTVVAKVLIVKGHADEIAKIDHEHFSYPDHGHIQICMR